ncbi:hypothetical protein SCOR_20515 [Sulfidibacter corallicola]
MPVFFLFDASGIIGKEGTIMTDGSVARQHKKGYGLTFLKSLDFARIFHDSPLEPEEKSEIVNARHAEVLAEDPLDLSNLKYIVCRSMAERETLNSLLSENVLDRWRPQVVIDRRGDLFFKRHFFIIEVSLSRSLITIRVSPDNTGPFDLQIVVKDEYGYTQVFERTRFQFEPNPYSLRISEPRNAYLISIHVNGFLAYRSFFQESPYQAKPHNLLF